MSNEKTRLVSGLKLRRALAEKGTSLVEVAAEAGVNVRTFYTVVARHYHGGTEPRGEVGKKVIEAVRKALDD